jgi:hypothetical protein
MRQLDSHAANDHGALDATGDGFIEAREVRTEPTGTRPRSTAGLGPARAGLWYKAMLCCGVFSFTLIAGAVIPEPSQAQHVTPVSRDAKIANALTAAPQEITRDAAVRDWPSKDGEGLALLRPGTNGWSCLPDDPTTPGNDPTCVDQTFLDAVSAFFSGQTPRVTRVGYGYMLTSDAEGSNVDPTATKATPTNQWHHAGPHVMLIYPDPKMLDGLPTTPSAQGPYVMFPGTPIAHVMLPVASGYLRAGAHDGGRNGGKRP